MITSYRGVRTGTAASPMSFPHTTGEILRGRERGGEVLKFQSAIKEGIHGRWTVYTQEGTGEIEGKRCAGGGGPGLI